MSNSFVSAYSNLFVSHSGWWCPALWLCLPLYIYIYSFVSRFGWLCPALCLSRIHLFALKAFHLSPALAGSVRLSGCLGFICLPLWLVVSGSLAVSNSFVSPYSNSFVSQSGGWCPALWLSRIHLSPLIAIHLSPTLAGGVRPSGFVSPYIYIYSFVSRFGWLCPALWLSRIHLFALKAFHLSPALAGSVRLSGCLGFICLPLYQLMP